MLNEIQISTELSPVLRNGVYARKLGRGRYRLSSGKSFLCSSFVRYLFKHDCPNSRLEVVRLHVSTTPQPNARKAELWLLSEVEYIGEVTSRHYDGLWAEQVDARRRLRVGFPSKAATKLREYPTDDTLYEDTADWLLQRPDLAGLTKPVGRVIPVWLSLYTCDETGQDLRLVPALPEDDVQAIDNYYNDGEICRD